uniref:Uncharacterized protein n=1 Tax=Romanomermis culicivorax TaxID=13658 RepID=A0A915JCM0_ROMCU
MAQSETRLVTQPSSSVTHANYQLQCASQQASEENIDKNINKRMLEERKNREKANVNKNEDVKNE